MRARGLLSVVILALAGCVGPPRPVGVGGFDQPCAGSPRFMDASQDNSAELDTLEWASFGVPERGWRVYGPAMAMEVGTRCAPDSGGFAKALAAWQAAHGLADDGRVSTAVLDQMKADWQARRPFVAIRAQGICPDPPVATALSLAPEGVGVKGKAVLLESSALEALGRMRAAAARDLTLPPGDETLTVFSGYRDPQADSMRCEQEQNCQGIVRAQCSAHRTGRAVDLVLGATPGYAIDSSAEENRLFQSRTPAYRWLVANAAQFGFVNYVYEPWHWEWVGDD